MRTIITTSIALALTAGLATAAPFGLVDRDNDGAVSKAEFVKNYGPELDVFSFRIIDGNHDGVIDAVEYNDARETTNGILSN